MKHHRKLVLLFFGGYTLALLLQAGIFVRRQALLYNDTYWSSLRPSTRMLDEGRAEAGSERFANLPMRSELLASLAAEQIVGVVAGLLLVGLPCVLLMLRLTRDERARHVMVEAELVLAAAQRLAEVEDIHYADRLVTLGRLASMAHELGTPLAVVQARAQMIAAGESKEHELQKDVEAILQQTRRMTTMVREVLALADQKTQLKTPVDLNALVNQTIGMMQPLVKQRNLTFKLVTESAAANTVGDASRLLQILTNLAMNAKQAMPKGGAITFRVGKRSARSPRGGNESEYFFVEVCDQGEGIPKRNLPRIFDTYFTTKKAGEGTGLGLSISYQIASEHGGFLEVESQQGKGSCFTLYLPMMEVTVMAQKAAS